MNSGKRSSKKPPGFKSNFTSTSPDAWNKTDTFVLDLFSPTQLLKHGFEGLEEILGVIESLDDALRPDTMSHTRRPLKYSREALRKRLHEAYVGPSTVIRLVRSRPPEVILSIHGWTENTVDRASVQLMVNPFDFVESQSQPEQILSFVRDLAAKLPLSFGVGHSLVDLSLGNDPRVGDTSESRRVYETFWLNLYGPSMVEQLGRQHLLSTPSAHMEELPGGAVLWLTRPTPADFYSDEARLAQARALVHLRPELNLDATLATLRQRSSVFIPVSVQFDPDVADILLHEVDALGLSEKRKSVERFNQYRPPPISEWLPATHAPAPNVDDVQAAIDTYEGLYAEQLVALFHKEEPSVMEDTLEALPLLDWQLWHFGWAKNLSHEQRETLVPALGAWLGRHLVKFLGGRWVPRRKLDETAVVVGDRAWLPFLRARHALQGPDAPLDFSCSQYFRTAQRLAQAAQAH